MSSKFSSLFTTSPPLYDALWRLSVAVIYNNDAKLCTALNCIELLIEFSTMTDNFPYVKIIFQVDKRPDSSMSKFDYIQVLTKELSL